MKPKQYLFLLLIAGCFPHPCVGQECAADGACDKHERCSVWKAEGECLRNKEYMNKHCPVSCRDVDRTVGVECKDMHERCPVWASFGECEENRVNMEKYCPKSCGICSDGGGNARREADDGCEDRHQHCNFWAKEGECIANKPWMEINCAKSCNTCDRIIPKVKKTSAAAELVSRTADFGIVQKAEGERINDIYRVMQETVSYMGSDQVQNLPGEVATSCKNRHELCSFWSLVGECENNKAYMGTNCAPACQSCHLIDYATRCPELRDANPALNPGDLNKMFEHIVHTAPGNRTLTDEERSELRENDMTEFTVVALSRPSESPAVEVSAVLDRSLPPWVIIFDDFVTPEECEEMIRLGYKYEYKRSEDVGPRRFDGSHDSIQSAGRTSENAWCSESQGCRLEEVPQRLHERISKVLGIPPQNSEDFQMLRYEKGQFYRTHHDYIPHQEERQCGPRILTFFLYLSDVEAGGGTNFPQLDITVEPKRGRALLWPSVMDSDPMKKDGRTMHQALPVKEGVKYAANGWIHMFDYIQPQKIGCT